MRATLITLSLTLLITTLLQGCAPIVVGGAAAGVSVIHDRRSAGTTLDDRTIELKILASWPKIKRSASTAVSASTALTMWYCYQVRQKQQRTATMPPQWQLEPAW